MCIFPDQKVHRRSVPCSLSNGDRGPLVILWPLAWLIIPLAAWKNIGIGTKSMFRPLHPLFNDDIDYRVPSTLLVLSGVIAKKKNHTISLIFSYKKNKNYIFSSKNLRKSCISYCTRLRPNWDVLYFGRFSKENTWKNENHKNSFDNSIKNHINVSETEGQVIWSDLDPL